MRFKQLLAVVLISAVTSVGTNVVIRAHTAVDKVTTGVLHQILRGAIHVAP